MWTYTKTDWILEDWFECEDYNRIRGNIEHLIELAFQLYPRWERPEIKTLDTGSFYFAQTFNAVEENLRLLADNTYKPWDFEGTEVIEGNKETWSNEDVNRIERTTQRLYGLLRSQYENRLTLAFELGGDWFG